MAEAAVWHWALALALLAGALIAAAGAGRPQRTWIGASVACLVAWTLFHTLFLAESYSPAGLFQPLFLVTGFALGRRASVFGGDRARLDAVTLAVAAIVGFALFASLVRGFPVAAPFETPAVLAALTNLALLPVLVYALWGPLPTPGRFMALALFFAGLIGAASRGGWLGLLVGLALAGLFFRGRLPGMRNTAAVAVAAGLGSGLVLLIRAAGPFLGHAAPGAAGRGWAGLAALFFAPSALETDSSLSRLELYGVAFDAVRHQAPLGSGYLSFAQVLEAGRERVPSYGSENVTFFVHNDYLQALLELGLPGLCALLAVVLVPLAMLFRHRNRMLPAEALPCGAWAAGLAAMAFQASVDFPFYIPVCLAVFGYLLGALDARCAGIAIGRIDFGTRTGASWPAVASAQRIAFGTGLALLLVPLAAEWSLAYADARWRKGQGENAAYGFELARRLQPADWRYAWFAGTFWAAQATATRNPNAAAFADASFAGGFASNPLEARNLLGRIELQRRMPQLLDHPATAGEVDAWSARALALAPRNPKARMERVFVLERSGRLDAARTEAVRFASDEPKNRSARALADRLKRGPQ